MREILVPKPCEQVDEDAGSHVSIGKSSDRLSCASGA